MRYLDEFRDPASVRALARRIVEASRRPCRIMEVCGGQTHTIVRYGLEELLPPHVELIHGPGCPVCVTPVSAIDAAISLAARPDVVVCSFGDMLRVPGSSRDLAGAKAAGGDVRVVYSPLDALELARRRPRSQVVFFAVGFETTAPANAMAVWRAAREGISNFSVLVSHVTVPPALRFLLSQADCRIDALLAAGHVCTVMGTAEYPPLVAEFRRPVVVTGFEPADILQGILMAVEQFEAGRHEMENQYSRAVRPEGNRVAREMISEVFEATDREWRGIGAVPASGYRLREAYRAHDAESRFGLAGDSSKSKARECDRSFVGGHGDGAESECLAGLVLQGRIRPAECPAFGTRCTPDHPLGAPMVSDEGACAAYHRYGRRRREA